MSCKLKYKNKKNQEVIHTKKGWKKFDGPISTSH